MLLVAILFGTIGLTLAMPTTPVLPNGISQCALAECPVYEVLEDYGSEIVKRREQGGLWVWKRDPTDDINNVTLDVYMSLHHYFTDNNMKRTRPVVVRSDASPSGAGEQYTLLFYVPRAFQVDAPAPSVKSGVQLNVTAPRDFYVISFFGPESYRNATTNRKRLVDFLKERDLCFNEETFFYARYNRPDYPPYPQRSEIMIPAESCPVMIAKRGIILHVVQGLFRDLMSFVFSIWP